MCSSLDFLVFLTAVLFQAGQTTATATSSPVSPPICNGSIIINPFNDLTKPYYWPDGWNEKLDPPSHNIDLQCSFLFNVPRGLYARLAMKGSVGGQADIILNDDTQYKQYAHDPNLEPYFFVHGSFKVSLVSQRIATIGTLGIKVVWSNFPSATPKRNRITNGTIHVEKASDAQNASVFVTDTDSKVSLVPVPISSMNKNQTILRNSLVFDGPTVYSNYSGNLYEIFVYGKQFVSTGNSLTVFTFEPQNDENMYVIQDYRDTMGFDSYTAVTCDDFGKCHALLESEFGKSAAVSVSKNGETLASGSVDYDGTLSVYSGVISSSNLLDSYNYTSSMTNLPHKYNFKVVQYVNDIGFASIVTLRN